jgi:hypothetical protein
MSDTALNLIIQYGTNAARIAFVPDPAAGSQVLYLWYETDNAPDTYAWDGAAWDLINGGAGASITALTGEVTATGPGSVAATIAANAIVTTKILDANVTFAKIQDLTGVSVLGRAANSTGVSANIAAGANDRLLTRVADALAFTQLTVGMVPDATLTPAKLTTAAKTKTIGIVIDGGGSAISTGIKGDISIPVAGTITAVRMLADQSGSAVVDIWKDTYANYPPTVADTITAAAKPTISGAVKSEDTTLTGWTTAIAAGDTLRFNVDSAATITRLTLQLTVVLT